MICPSCKYVFHLPPIDPLHLANRCCPRCWHMFVNDLSCWHDIRPRLKNYRLYDRDEFYHSSDSLKTLVDYAETHAGGWTIYTDGTRYGSEPLYTHIKPGIRYQNRLPEQVS